MASHNFFFGLFFSLQKNDLFIHATGLSIALIGWLIFSNYHTKIAIHKLKEITNEYVNSVQKDNVQIKRNKRKK